MPASRGSVHASSPARSQSPPAQIVPPAPINQSLGDRDATTDCGYPLKCFPQLVSVVPGSERIERYQQQILAALTPAEAETWHQAAAAAEADGTFFIAQAYHCAVGTKPV